MKQSSLDDHESLGIELSLGNDNGDEIQDLSEYEERRLADFSENSQVYNNYQQRPSTPTPMPLPVPRGNVAKLRCLILS